MVASSDTGGGSSTAAPTGMHINGAGKVVHTYELIKFLGRGTYATVFAGRRKSDGFEVAVKKMKRDRDERENGISIPSMREIKILKEVQHPNIITLHDVYTEDKITHLVFDYMFTDMEVVIKDRNIVLEPSDIKSYMHQMLLGLEHMHKLWILHRDMKPNNLLIGSDGQLKITDFGMARYAASPDIDMTNRVVTVWYRSPELLLGAKQYSVGVDMWATGCILAEMMLRRPLLPGGTEIDQLQKIYQTFGTPTVEQWPSVESLPNYNFIKMEKYPTVPLETIFTATTRDTIKFMAPMFVYDPVKRATATDCLKDPWFTSEPLPTHSEDLPRKLNHDIDHPNKRVLDDAKNSSAAKRLKFDS
eukprot:Clim_evm15s44 gene=Clim_evmTU15s44